MQSIGTDATGKAKYKESRLPFANLSTQVTKNTEETIHLVLRDICEVSVRKFDISGFVTSSAKKRVL